MKRIVVVMALMCMVVLLANTLVSAAEKNSMAKRKTASALTSTKSKGCDKKVRKSLVQRGILGKDGSFNRDAVTEAFTLEEELCLEEGAITE